MSIAHLYVDEKPVSSSNPIPMAQVAVDAPAAANSAGIPGQVAYDDEYIYVCVGANTWKRGAVATWPAE
jgi:hypothetical protein